MRQTKDKCKCPKQVLLFEGELYKKVARSKSRLMQVCEVNARAPTRGGDAGPCDKMKH